MINERKWKTRKIDYEDEKSEMSYPTKYIYGKELNAFAIISNTTISITEYIYVYISEYIYVCMGACVRTIPTILIPLKYNFKWTNSAN